MRGSRGRLYDLLPAYLRYRDQSEPLDSPLRALMAVLELEHAAVECDIDQLYDDWFIETCQDWLAPFIGDLIGIRGFEDPSAWVPSQRAYIANTLSYRRLKGTLPIIERVVGDVTGWPCVASAFRFRLAATQHLDHVRLDQGGLVDVRATETLARFESPFDSVPRTPQLSGGVGLQPADCPRDGYNTPGLGLYLWRVRSYPVRRSSARRRPRPRGCPASGCG